MVRSKAIVALAVRAHAADGSSRHDADAASRLKSAARTLVERMPSALTAPSEVTDDAVLIMHLAAPSHGLEVILCIADQMRPLKTTFSVAAHEAVPTGDGGAEAYTRARSASRADRPGTHGEDIADALLAIDRAVNAAVQGIAETDAKASRVVVAGPERDLVLSCLIDMILEAYDSMTDRQRHILRLVKEVGGQQEVAKHLGVSRQAVNQSLASSGWHHLRSAEEATRERLGQVGHGW